MAVICCGLLVGLGFDLFGVICWMICCMGWLLLTSCPFAVIFVVGFVVCAFV